MNLMEEVIAVTQNLGLQNLSSQSLGLQNKGSHYYSSGRLAGQD